MSGQEEETTFQLRRAYEQVLDEKRVVEDHLHSARVKQGIYLDKLARAAVLIQELEKCIFGRDLVRTSEIQKILKEWGTL